MDQTKKLLLELIEVNKGKRNYAEVSINRLKEFLYAVEQAENVNEFMDIVKRKNEDS